MSRWVNYETAAKTLGKSTRTIERWAKTGRLKKGDRNGRAYVEIDGDDPLEAAVESVGNTSDRLAEVSAANVIQLRQLSDILSATQLDARREILHARRVSRIAAVVSVITSVAMVAVGAAMGVTYHQEAIRHVGQVDVLEDRADDLERERDDARQAVTQANSRTAAADQRAVTAEDQAATDRARIDAVNEALAGLAIPADTSWATRVAGR